MGRKGAATIYGHQVMDTGEHLSPDDSGDGTVTLPLETYNALIEELAILQDSVDALVAQAQISAGGTKRKKLAAFVTELEADGLLD